LVARKRPVEEVLRARRDLANAHLGIANYSLALKTDLCLPAPTQAAVEG
jgi:hypothetical protein